jgi:hypothetical protein
MDEMVLARQAGTQTTRVYIDLTGSGSVDPRLGVQLPTRIPPTRIKCTMYQRASAAGCTPF